MRTWAFVVARRAVAAKNAVRKDMAMLGMILLRTTVVIVSVEGRDSERGKCENKPRPASMGMRMAGVKRL
tara:strand:+ start:21608 stop:21817 length:210 start_codon:yes stop_codon:yes gene_type:complete